MSKSTHNKQIKRIFDKSGLEIATYVEFDGSDDFEFSSSETSKEETSKKETPKEEITSTKPKFDPYIDYIEIRKSYAENTKRNHRSIRLSSYIGKIKNKNLTSSFFEILNNYTNLKPYFDIEKIPVDQPNLIYDIIGDLRTWFSKETGDELGDYILTLNKHSISHDGLSYHLIFYEWSCKQNNILSMLNNFLESHTEYVNYMDGSVYSKGRLFRSINQIGVDKKLFQLSKFEDDLHTMINVEQTDDTIAKSIIQNTDDTKKLRHEFKSVKRPRAKNISNFTSYKFNKKQPTIIIHNHIEKDDKNDFIPNKNETKPKIDDDIYSRAFVIKLKDDTNEYIKTYISELLEYYDKNKTFDNYKQSKEQILSILKLLN